MLNRRGAIVLLIAAALAIAACVAKKTHAAEGHTHQGSMGRFYQTWMMPDAPRVSCCHDEDCGPAASRWMGDHWEARWKEEDEWIVIPAAKVERDRDTPDGRSHMCGHRSLGFTVFCFVPGGGA